MAVFQPRLAHFRVRLFEEMNRSVPGGVTVFAGREGSVSRDMLGDLSDRVVWLRVRRAGPLWMIPGAVREVWSRRWAVLVLPWNVRQVELLPVLLAARLRSVPVVLWGHGVGSGRSALIMGLRRQQARLSAAVMTYSDSGAAEVRNLGTDTPIHVLLNTTGRPAPGPPDTLSRPTGAIAFVGTLNERKRVDLLIDALALLLERGGREATPSVDVIGSGPDRRALESRAELAGVADLFRWHGEVYDWARVKEILVGCDLVVLPGHAGLGVVDAFAAARGVVVCGEPGANPPEADLVEHGVTGIRFMPQSVEALAGALDEVYRDSDLTAMSRRAAELYRDRLTMKAAGEAFRDLVLAVAR